MSPYFRMVGNPEPESVVLYPGKVPLRGQPHVLDVCEDDMGICHTDDCMNAYGNVACDVDDAERWGIGFWHHAKISESGEKLTDGLIPGEYWIEFRVYGEGEDEEISLELMYPEEEE